MSAVSEVCQYETFVNSGLSPAACTKYQASTLLFQRIMSFSLRHMQCVRWGGLCVPNGYAAFFSSTKNPRMSKLVGNQEGVWATSNGRQHTAVGALDL